MALLLRREVLIPHLRGGETFALPSQPSDVWFGMLINNAEQTPIGFLNVHTEPVQREGAPGVEGRVMGRMRLNLGSYQGELLVQGTAWATRTEGLREFQFNMQSGQHGTSVKGRVTDGNLVGALETAGESIEFNVPLASNRMMASAPGLGNLSMPDLQVGEEVLIDAFDPLTMSSGRARVTCLREEEIYVMGVRTPTKVVATELSGITSTAWVEEQGNVLRAETPIGFVLQRMEQTEARKLLLEQSPDGEGLLRMAAVTATGKTPVRGAKKMLIRLSGAEGAGAVVEDASQREAGPGLLLIQPAGPEGEGTPLDADERAEALANDVFLQLEHPRIVAAAKEAIGGAADPWEMSKQIYAWVHREVRKGIVPSLPTALDVLDTREGDCNEHTMLFTALARASGIPTRMAIGVVWSEDFGAFYYHAWPEVYVGRWVWMDPTLGQEVADATHIKLINGDLSSWWKVAPFMGKVKVEVLEIE